MNPENQSQIQNSIKLGMFQSYNFIIKTEEKRKRKYIWG